MVTPSSRPPLSAASNTVRPVANTLSQPRPLPFPVLHVHSIAKPIYLMGAVPATIQVHAAIICCLDNPKSLLIGFSASPLHPVVQFSQSSQRNFHCDRLDQIITLHLE